MSKVQWFLVVFFEEISEHVAFEGSDDHSPFM